MPSSGRHRLDLSLTKWDSAEADSFTLLPGYTLALGNGIRISLTTSLTYLEQHDGLVTDSEGNVYEFGVGDSIVTLQYDPSRNITASPWIPDTLGLHASIMAPTGNAAKGLGQDIWSSAIGAGWMYPIAGGFWLVPAANYEWSFREGSRGLSTEYAWVSTGLLWVSPHGFWLGYTPYFGRDLVADEWSTDHVLVIGKMWDDGFGISLDYGKINRIDDLARRDDWAAIFNFYYQFGSPP